MRTIRQPKRSTYHIEMIRLDDDQAIRMWNLDAFAAEFGHEIRRIFPIFIVLVDGTLSAYFYAQPQVCIYPAVHPAHFNPRMFYEVGRIIVGATKMNFGNPLWLIDSESDLNRPELLEKVYLLETGLRVYQTPD
jgi:hypothetical protein